MQKHFNITISGKVQGVFYRASAKEKAIDLGIKGYVMNLENGNVYMEAEGYQNQLDELVKWCKKGPAIARVEAVDVVESDWIGYEDFLVLKL
jgi:acylphosphatase